MLGEEEGEHLVDGEGGIQTGPGKGASVVDRTKKWSIEDLLHLQSCDSLKPGRDPS